MRKTKINNRKRYFRENKKNSKWVLDLRQKKTLILVTFWDFLWSLDHRLWALFKDSDAAKSFNFDSKVLEFIQNRTELVEHYIGN